MGNRMTHLWSSVATHEFACFSNTSGLVRPLFKFEPVDREWRCFRALLHSVSIYSSLHEFMETVSFEVSISIGQRWLSILLYIDRVVAAEHFGAQVGSELAQHIGLVDGPIFDGY